MAYSFKLKVAIFAAVSSGIIFLGFASLFMTMTRRNGLERIDRHLRELAEPQARRPPPWDDWPRFDAALSHPYHPARSRYPILIRVFDRSGATIYRSPRWPEAWTATGLGIEGYLKRPIPPPPPYSPPFRQPLSPRPMPGRPRPALPGRQPLLPPLYLDRALDGRPWRLLILASDAITLAVAADVTDFHADIRGHWRTFALTGPLALLLLAGAGWLLADRTLRPLSILTRVARGITAQGLDQRVRTPGADHEIQALVDVINGMLDRLETSFNQAARFSADAAHELKTPLAILQGQLEQALQDAPDPSREQETFASLLEEVQRLTRIVRKLLLLAQSDAGQLRLCLEPVCLSRELDTLLDDLPLLAPNVRARRDIAPDIHLRADPDLLRNLLQNLIVNAVTHSPPGENATFALRAENACATLIVSNRIDPGKPFDRARLFDRFYRGDPSRSRMTAGAGLGLSLAREISRAHGGDLTAELRPDGWIDFRLTLPAV